MKKWIPVVLTTAGLFLVATSTLLLLLFPAFVEHQMTQQFILREDMDRMESFIEPPITFYRNIYFFNVTNPVAILEGAKPMVEEIGPFVYTEMKKKLDVEWDNDCLLYTSPSPRDKRQSRMPSSA